MSSMADLSLVTCSYFILAVNWVIPGHFMMCIFLSIVLFMEFS